MSGGNYARDAKPDAGGRWPANLIHDGSEEVVGLFPETAAAKSAERGERSGVNTNFGGSGGVRGHDDNGGSAARFFYTAKAAKSDRDDGVAGVAGVGALRDGGRESQPRKNHHPTVKPTDLMRYLCRLVTPPGGTVLDPFMGSGSTGRAALLEGFRFIGIEREAQYLEIARARVQSATPALWRQS
jgi:site-specific DNA-methyltransferase (adenine-specific)